MIDTLYALIGTWLQTALPVAACISFAWGVCSVVFSPCHLAALPVMALHAAGYTQALHTDADTGTNASAAVASEQSRDGSPLAACTTGEYAQGTDISRLRLGDTVFFAVGYFVAIAVLGIACACVGRILGVEGLGGHYWFIPAGAILLWFGISLWREHACSYPGGFLRWVAQYFGKWPMFGAISLGSGYGILSSGCTLAFLAPILLVSLPYGVWTACVMSTAFALGHCLPMALVGCATHLAQRLMRVCHLAPKEHESHEHTPAEQRFRRIAAVIICCAALVLLLHPFLEH